MCIRDSHDGFARQRPVDKMNESVRILADALSVLIKIRDRYFHPAIHHLKYAT